MIVNILLGTKWPAGTEGTEENKNTYWFTISLPTRLQALKGDRFLLGQNSASQPWTSDRAPSSSTTIPGTSGHPGLPAVRSLLWWFRQNLPHPCGFLSVIFQSVTPDYSLAINPHFPVLSLE